MIFETGPAIAAAAGDAWVVRLQVDPTDWSDATKAAVQVFKEEMCRRYTDSMGNSAMDAIEVWGDGALLCRWELFEPARRTGPEGADVNQPKYRRGIAA